MPDPEVHPLSTLIVEAVRLARTGTSLNNALRILGFVNDELAKIAETDGDLGPEILAALKQIVEAGETLGRAMEYVAARYDAVSNRALNDEGGSL